MGPAQEILNEYIKYGLLEKYKDQAIVIKQLDEYMKTGSPGLITRDNGLRDAFKQYLSKDMVASITQGNAENYVIYYMNYLSSQMLNSNNKAVEQTDQTREQMTGELTSLIIELISDATKLDESQILSTFESSGGLNGFDIAED